MNNLVVIIKIKLPYELKQNNKAYPGESEEMLKKVKANIPINMILRLIKKDSLTDGNNLFIRTAWCIYRPATLREQFLYYTHGSEALLES